MHIGREGQLIRSWPVAPGEFFRLFLDEPLHLTAEFKQPSPDSRIVLHTNLHGNTEEWKEIEFSPLGQGRFAVSVMPSRCGIFLFKIKHSPDKGKTWFWDRTPFTKVVVDPAIARDIRLYTLIPSASGTITQWTESLGHIKELGFNMVHLLPITPMDSSRSPYAAKELFSVDAEFADPDVKLDPLTQFENFVKSAREKGIRLCVDLVLNHVGITSKMATLSPEWIVPDKNEENGLMRTGCWHMNSWIKWGDLAKINYDHPEENTRHDLWDYMKKYALFWAYYASYTGGMVRLDNLHSSHAGFISELIATLRTHYPELVIQAEYFSDSNTLVKTASENEINLFLADPWSYPFAESLREYLLYLHRISSKLRFLTPMTTHDTGAPTQLYGSPDSVVARYFTVALMSTGQTGLVQGAEHGVSEKIDFIGGPVEPRYPFPHRYDDAITKINRLLSRHPLFHEGDNLRFVDGNHGALIAAYREEKKVDGEKFLLIANFDTVSGHTLRISFESLRLSPASSAFQNCLGDGSATVDQEGLVLWVEPCGIRAYQVRALI